MKEPNYPIPIFTIFVKDGGKIEIYANGLVEGDVKVQGISNHLPWLLSYDQLEKFSKRTLSIQSEVEN